MRARALVVLALSACKPDLGTPLSTLTESRVIAVRVSPPEAAPGAKVMLEAVIAGPDGPVASSVDWAFCTDGKALTDNDVVASACLTAPGTPIGASSESVVASLPLDACKRFGPELPPSMAGQPMLRPRDPDVTGGFYQPVRLRVEGASGIALPRVECSLPNAPVDIALEYKQRYRANANPALDAVEVLVDGETVAPEALPAHRSITVRARWTAESQEGYVVYDLPARALVERREVLRLSWFASAGALADEHTGPSGGASASDNAWFTAGAGPAHLWVVLRDDRGGIDVRHLALTIVE